MPAETGETVEGVRIDEAVGSQGPLVDAAQEPAGQSQAGSTPGEQPDLFGDSPDLSLTPEPSSDQLGSGAEVDAGPVPVAPVEQGDDGLDDGQDWEGDPGRIPAAWFAEIDPHASKVLKKRWPDVLAPASPLKWAR